MDVVTLDRFRTRTAFASWTFSVSLPKLWNSLSALNVVSYTKLLPTLKLI